MMEGERGREVIQNCATLIDALVVTAARDAATARQLQMESERKSIREDLLRRFGTQWVMISVDLYESNSLSKRIGTLHSGDAVDVVEGLELDIDQKSAELSPVVKVSTGSKEGWIPSSKTLRWGERGKPQTEEVPTISTRPPFSRSDYARVIAEALFNYKMDLEQLKRVRQAGMFSEDGLSEAEYEAKRDLSYLCRMRAEFAADFGSKALAALDKQTPGRLRAEGLSLPQVRSLLRQVKRDCR